MNPLSIFNELSMFDPPKHPKFVFVGSRKEKTATGKVRTITRVSEEKRSRYSGADLRKLRAERGVGPIRKIVS
jgi:hypothetical protein